MEDFIYKELSFKLIGLAYEVYNCLGYGLKEKVYTDAFEKLLRKEGIEYRREYYYSLKVRDEIVGKRYFDFLIEGKLILEFKIGGDKYFDAYCQLLDYLKSTDLKLGIIVRFTKDGVKVKRIPNLY
ncbi:MAG TPA: GxxExxY protein [Patescibacteria group bacterium]|nr:GxxExxY protein [Patescibacteria group bacterium]